MRIYVEFDCMLFYRNVSSMEGKLAMQDYFLHCLFYVRNNSTAFTVGLQAA